MRDLIVVGFDGTHRAAEVLNQVLELNADWAVDLHLEDAVAVYRTRDGKLRVDESLQPTSKDGAALGGVVGALIGGILAIPFTGGASAAIAAAAVGSSALTFGATGAVIGGADAYDDKARYGLSEDFVKQVGGMVQPGQSALFVMGASDKPAKIAENFKGYGGTILRTTLRPELAKQVQQVIGADRPAAR
jgi:uncharacterized membrane protein